ncbi:MAG TPA: L-2-amino-thiazoline-4-carboxylic acid hydrolase, partial [Candidatus Limnocylindrales bacterium]|nr:L-2-amino-thiazoline-4-carboxylic acid hydrolase [Candidatus Limnocylindrales bacterium]
GGRHLLELGAFTIGGDDSLRRRGVDDDAAATLVAEIVVEANRGALAWVHRLGWLRHRAPLDRLRWEGRLLFATYYRRPAWVAEPVEVPDGYGFDMRHCAIADFYRGLGLGDRCEQTICALDEWVARQYAEPAGIVFRRTGTLSGGADRCDFRYRSVTPAR